MAGVNKIPIDIVLSLIGGANVSKGLAMLKKEMVGMQTSGLISNAQLKEFQKVDKMSGNIARGFMLSGKVSRNYFKDITGELRGIGQMATELAVQSDTHKTGQEPIGRQRITAHDARLKAETEGLALGGPMPTKKQEYAEKTARAHMRLTKTSNTLRLATRNLTGAAMSMLGVFFGGFTTIRMMTRASTLLIRPLQDINTTMETLGKAFGFAQLTNIGPFADGTVNLGEATVDTMQAWMNFTSVMEQFKALPILITSELFNNTEIMDTLNNILSISYSRIDDIVAALVPFVSGILDLGLAILSNKDQMMDMAKTIIGLIDSVLKIATPLMTMAMRIFGLGDAADSMNGAIDSADGTMGKFGARLTMFLTVMAGASSVAMILLPILSLFQSAVMGVYAAVVILDGATWLLNFALTAHLSTTKILQLAYIKSIVITKLHTLANTKLGKSFIFLMAPIYGVISGLAKYIASSIAAKFSTWGLNAALLACPLTWMVGIIAAIVAAIAFVIKAFSNWEDTMNSLRRASEKLKEILTKLWDVMSDLAEVQNAFNVGTKISQSIEMRSRGETGPVSDNPIINYITDYINVNVDKLNSTQDVDEVVEKINSQRTNYNTNPHSRKTLG